MRDDSSSRKVEQIETRTMRGFANTTNEEADDYKGDDDDRRGAVKIERQWQWQVIALAKAVGARWSRKRANPRCRRGEKLDRAG